MLRRLSAVIAVSAIVCTIQLSVAPAAMAVLSTTPDPSWMTNGLVYALQPVGTTMYIGGQFTQIRSTPQGTVGPKIIGIADIGAIDTTTGQGIKTFKHVVTHSGGNAYVKDLALSPDGATLYVAGHFDGIDGVAEHNLAAIDLASDTVDASFTPAAGGNTSAVFVLLPAPDGSKLYMGGSFTAVNGDARTRLAAILPDGSLDPSWNPAANKHVRSLTYASDGNTIFIGGAFTTMNGTTRPSLVVVSAGWS